MNLDADAVSPRYADAFKYKLGADRIRHTVYRAERRAAAQHPNITAVSFPSGHVVAGDGYVRVGAATCPATVAELEKWATRIRCSLARIVGHGAAREAFGTMRLGRGRSGGGYYSVQKRIATVHPTQHYVIIDRCGTYESRVAVATITHELAHGIDAAFAGNIGHGPTFRAAHCVTWALAFGTSMRLQSEYRAAGVPAATFEEMKLTAPILALAFRETESW